MIDSSTIKALAFDYYGTIGAKQGLARAIDAHAPGKGPAMAKLWFATCQRYCFQNGTMRRYQPWDELTVAAFDFAAADLGLSSSDSIRDQLIEADCSVSAYVEAPAALARLAARFSLNVLSMGATWMIERSQQQAGIAGHFDRVITTQSARVYKPDPAAYQVGVDSIGLATEQICFVSGNSFDVIGARNFGYPVVWVRRYAQPLDNLGLEPDLIVADLSELADALGA